MKAVCIRVLSGVFGAMAAMIAIAVPFSFIMNTTMEIGSAKQYHGRISVVGGIGASLLVVAVTGLFGIGAYRLLRRAFVVTS